VAAGLTLTFYSVLFPIVMFLVLFNRHYKWEQPDFARNYDSMTIALYVHDKWSAVLYALSLTRSFFMIWLAVSSDWSLL
jgi:hypothetical protein